MAIKNQLNITELYNRKNSKKKSGKTNFKVLRAIKLKGYQMASTGWVVRTTPTLARQYEQLENLKFSGYANAKNHHKI